MDDKDTDRIKDRSIQRETFGNWMLVPLVSCIAGNIFNRSLAALLHRTICQVLEAFRHIRRLSSGKYCVNFDDHHVFLSEVWVAWICTNIHLLFLIGTSYWKVMSSQCLLAHYYVAGWGWVDGRDVPGHFCTFKRRLFAITSITLMWRCGRTWFYVTNGVGRGGLGRLVLRFGSIVVVTKRPVPKDTKNASATNHKVEQLTF